MDKETMLVITGSLVVIVVSLLIYERVSPSEHNPESPLTSITDEHAEP